MTRSSVLLLAALIAATPVADAVAQDRGRDRDRREQVRPDRSRSDPRLERGRDQGMNAGQIAQRVSAGRDGRMLAMRPGGGGYVVRWEYPGGRVADISVDGRTGRVTGER